jgi:hypothetical protein
MRRLRPGLKPGRAAVPGAIRKLVDGRRGQNTTEYCLLLCALLVVFGLVASFLKNYIPKLADRAFELIVNAALSLALP